MANILVLLLKKGFVQLRLRHKFTVRLFGH